MGSLLFNKGRNSVKEAVAKLAHSIKNYLIQQLGNDGHVTKVVNLKEYHFFCLTRPTTRHIRIYCILKKGVHFYAYDI